MDKYFTPPELSASDSTHTHIYQKKPSSPQGGCEKREALKTEVRGIKRDLTVAKVES